MQRDGLSEVKPAGYLKEACYAVSSLRSEIKRSEEISPTAAKLDHIGAALGKYSLEISDRQFLAGRYLDAVDSCLLAFSVSRGWERPEAIQRVSKITEVLMRRKMYDEALKAVHSALGNFYRSPQAIRSARRRLGRLRDRSLVCGRYDLALRIALNELKGSSRQRFYSGLAVLDAAVLRKAYPEAADCAIALFEFGGRMNVSDSSLLPRCVKIAKFNFEQGNCKHVVRLLDWAYFHSRKTRIHESVHEEIIEIASRAYRSGDIDLSRKVFYITTASGDPRAQDIKYWCFTQELECREAQSSSLSLEGTGNLG